MESPETVLDFWFPEGLDVDEAAHRKQLGWWFLALQERAVAYAARLG